jgi:carboxyl-terminal processing protease
MAPLKRNLVNIVVLLGCVLIGFVGGEYVAEHPGIVNQTIFPDFLAKLSPGATDQTAVFRSVWDQIHTQYVNRNLNDNALIQGAVQGLVNGLNDPYTVYLTPSEAQSFANDISGVFEGVGMEIGKKADKITIIAPLTDSPAAKAGIQAGDMIISVDNHDVSQMSTDQVVELIRGPEESTVTLVIQRGTNAPKTVKLVRAKITIAPVSTKTITANGKKIRYIDIMNFNEQTSNLVRQAAAAGIAENAVGYIIDLRNDPGGYLDQAVKVASVVIPSGNIVSEVSRDGQHRNLDATGNAILAGQKIVVLINQGSASAAEIVAGALQDTKTATLIGETTYGKGSVQQLEEIVGGGSLKITVAKWLTPNGRSISDEGIAPDMAITISAEDITAGRDPQLQKAIDQLSK